MRRLYFYWRSCVYRIEFECEPAKGPGSEGGMMVHLIGISCGYLFLWEPLSTTELATRVHYKWSYYANASTISCMQCVKHIWPFRLSYMDSNSQKRPPIAGPIFPTTIWRAISKPRPFCSHSVHLSHCTDIIVHFFAEIWGNWPQFISAISVLVWNWNEILLSEQ